MSKISKWVKLLFEGIMSDPIYFVVLLMLPWVALAELVKWALGVPPTPMLPLQCKVIEFCVVIVYVVVGAILGNLLFNRINRRRMEEGGKEK